MLMKLGIATLMLVLLAGRYTAYTNKVIEKNCNCGIECHGNCIPGCICEKLK